MNPLHMGVDDGAGDGKPDAAAIDDPVGENPYIDGVPFLVVGLFSSEDSAIIADMMGGSASILVPYTTAMKMNNQSVVTAFTVYLADGVDSETAADLIEAEMDVMFSFEDDCFTITTMSGIEGESIYSIAASTDKVYDATGNKFVHVGEEVYLKGERILP